MDNDVCNCNSLLFLDLLDVSLCIKSRCCQ